MKCFNVKSFIIGLIAGLIIASVMIIAGSNLMMTQYNTQSGTYQKIEYKKKSMIHRNTSTPEPTDIAE